jgi:sulfur relay protein TusB/DsrH
LRSEGAGLKKLVLLNRCDPASLLLAERLIASGEELCVVLIQDAIYLALKSSQSQEPVIRIMEKGVKFFLLAVDVGRRGVLHNLVSGVELIDYDRLIELLFHEDQKVINL